MQPVPRIFVSATSRDLRTARGLVSEGLRRMECLPIVQDDFPPDYKSVRDMLRTKISTCNAVVHLAGFYYGAEPQPVLPGPDRRSFTQMEYEIAMELKLPCYVFLCGQNFPFDKHDPEPEDKQQLQMAHRDRLLQRDELFYEFASPEELANRTRELQLSVEGLRKELAKERARRRLAMGAAIAALVIATGGGIWMHGRQQKTEAVNVQQTSEIAALKAQLEGPTFIVGKVNAAMMLVREQGKGTEEEMKATAINLVAAELKKPADEIKKSIESATELCRQLIAAAQTEGRNDPTKLTDSRLLEAETLQKLADAHLAAGRVNEAVAALQQRFALIDREKDPEIWAKAAEDLAKQLRARQSYVESRKIRRDALEWAKASKAFGPEHPTTLRLMAGLADGGIPNSEAQELIRFVLKVRERDLGMEHPDTLAAVSVLARVASNAKECEALYRRVIAAKTKAFGAEHEETLFPTVLLAKALKIDWSDYKGAGELLEKVLEIRQRTLGPEHDKTLTAMSLLADLRGDQEDYPESIKLNRQALAIRERTDGPDGKETLVLLNNLAIALSSSELPGSLDEATALGARVLETEIRVSGAGQPSTLISFRNHAAHLEAKGDIDGGRKLRLRALDEQEKAVGEKDTAFLTSLKKTIETFRKKKDYKTALLLAQRYLKMQEANLPEGAPAILNAMASVADLHDYLDNVAEAVRLTRLVIELCERKQPALKSFLAAQYNNQSVYLARLGQHPEALQAMRKSVELAKDALSENDEWRAKYEKRLATLESEAKQPPTPAGTPPTKSTASKDDKAPPSIDTYADFRKNVRDRMKKENWREVKEVLPDSRPDHELYVIGAFDGKELRWLMHVDSIDDSNETLTFYYWSEGWLTSIYRVRTGSAVPFKGVAKATDTYNFLTEKLVSWQRTRDGREEFVDTDTPDFATSGQRMIVDGKAAQSIVLKAASKAIAKPATPAPAAATANQPPSLKEYNIFRTEVDDASKSAGWKQVTQDLPGTGNDRRVYLNGWFEGKQLRKLMRVDAVGDTGGTFTFYYWSKGGAITSVFRLRKGIGVQVKGATKTTDTYNFFDEKLVSWESGKDGKNEIVDPKTAGFAGVGSAVLAEANEGMEIILKARTGGPVMETVVAPAKSAPPAPEKAPPSLDGFADLRKSINDKQKSEGWKEINETLPGAEQGRELSVTGWVADGKTLRKLMKVDAKDDKNGTWTFYYWSQGWLTSVFRVREGTSVPVKGVAKATDTYNFWNGKLVSWKRTQDDAEKVEEAADNDFPAIGKRIIAEANEASKPILKSIGSE